MSADFSLGSQASSSSSFNPFSTLQPQSLLKHRDLRCSKPLISSVREGKGDWAGEELQQFTFIEHLLSRLTFQVLFMFNLPWSSPGQMLSVIEEET